MEKDDILNAALGKRIKEIRQKRNLSQDSFAEMIDVCNGTHVSNIDAVFTVCRFPDWFKFAKPYM